MQGAERITGYLSRAFALRKRLSTQMYFGIAGGVLMTVAASLVGVMSFNRVGEFVSHVNDDSLPDMAAAFDVGLTSGTLASAGGQLTTTTSPSEFNQLLASVEAARSDLQAQLDVLEQRAIDRVLFDRIRTDVGTLISNIDAIQASMLEQFALNARIEGVQLEIAQLTTRVNDLVIPAIDDQIFYVVTGYRDAQAEPASLDEHLSIDEVNTYQRLSELQSDATLASQILTSAFALGSAAEVEPLRERFWAVEGRIQGNLTAFEGNQGYRDLEEIFAQLIYLGSGEGRTFDLVTQLLRLSRTQDELVDINRNITIQMLGDVATLATQAQASAQESAEASTGAISFGRLLLIGITALAIVGALLVSWLAIGRSLLRRLEMLSVWMQKMAAGDLEARAEVGGHDEVADMAAALEVFRRHALEVQRLNLVEQQAQELQVQKDALERQGQELQVQKGELERQGQELQVKNDELEKVLGDLQNAQDQIVMQEKLAALGELTAGVAHEIRNPLNFVKNFSEASNDLISELRDILKEEDGETKEITEDDKSYILEVSDDLESNLERVLSHTARANRIVEDMLKMGRSSTSWQMTDMNTLVEEYARLAYHSARGTDQDVLVDFQFDLDESMEEMEVVTQDMGRVFLNMVGNSCYATNEKRQQVLAGGGTNSDYMPTIWISTKRDEENAVIRIRDNGMGMPPEVQEKIFNPFFTTKPTDKGTGLGLAISADIIRTHGGAIEVESEEGNFTEMKITLPLSGGVHNGHAAEENAPAWPRGEADDDTDTDDDDADDGAPEADGEKP